METIKDILLINAYWLSLPLIGFVLLRLIRDIKIIPNGMREGSRLILKQHSLVVLLLSFVFTVFLCAVISLIFYIFNAPVKLLALMYVGSVLGACVYMFVFFIRRLWIKTDIDLLRLKNHTLLTKALVLVMLLAFLADYLLAIYIRSNVGGDTIYHMSRVVDIINYGFNIQTSFFHNLKDGAYHYNVIYALYAVPAKILHLEPIRVWEYSLGFYRLMQWLAIFTLGLYVFREWIKAKANTLPLAVIGVLSAMAFYSSYFFIATYPNQVVNIWLILFVVCLACYEKKSIVGLAMIGLAFLITATHPSYALVAACFVGLLSLMRLAIEKKEFLKKKVTIRTYAISMLLLMVGPLITKLTPSNLNSAQMHLNEPVLLNVLGMQIKNPLDAIPVNFIGWILLIAGIIATLFILYKLWARKFEWSMAFTVLLFFPIMIYLPVTFTVLYQFLPVWLIDRFGAMNILVYLLIPLAIWAIFWITGLFLKKLNSTFTGYTRLHTVLFVGVVLVLSGFGAVESYKLLAADRAIKKDTYAHMEQTIKDFKPILNSQKVVVSNQEFSYYLMSMFPIDVVAVEVGHSPLSADATSRISCQNRLMKEFNYADLNAVKASYVAIPTYDQNRHERDVANTKPYLTLIAQNQDFYIYEFIKTDQLAAQFEHAAYEPCKKYQQIEK